MKNVIIQFVELILRNPSKDVHTILVDARNQILIPEAVSALQTRFFNFHNY